MPRSHYCALPLSYVRRCRRVKASKSNCGVSHRNVRDIRCKYPADGIDAVSPRSARGVMAEQRTAVCLTPRRCSSALPSRGLIIQPCSNLCSCLAALPLHLLWSWCLVLRSPEGWLQRWKSVQCKTPGPKEEPYGEICYSGLLLPKEKPTTKQKENLTRITRKHVIKS